MYKKMVSTYPLSTKPLYSHVLATSRASLWDIDSDISTAGSVRSDDNQLIARLLGITDHDELHTDRFQIDRRKLQKMIKTECYMKRSNSAELYFDKIMRTTETYIRWPRRLKIDAKSKKDPYVEVFGKEDDITWARGLILANLNPRGTPLKLKIAISNSDHLFILGRANNNVNRIMDETDTHIQFPDQNPRNMLKKSNQVSVYGHLEGLERARALLRLSTPLLMSFELPAGQPMPPIENAEATFNVQITVTSRLNSNTSLILVKGSAKRADKVKEATRALINSMCGKIATRTLVSVQLEISPQFQDTVKGLDNAYILNIMENTKTKIFFPDLTIRGNSRQRSQVTITGTIEGVYTARQELVGNLPIELTFDIPGDSQNKATEVMNLGTKFGVCITLSQKERDSSLSVTIKGAEKYVNKIYEVYHNIVELNNTLPTEEKVPKSFYLLEGAYQRVMNSLVNSYVESVVERTDTTTNIVNENTEDQNIPNGMWFSNQSHVNSRYLQVTQTNTLLEEFCAVYTGQEELQPTYSPDSGHSSESVHQGEPQSNEWTLFGTEGTDAVKHINLGGVEETCTAQQFDLWHNAFDASPLFARSPALDDKKHISSESDNHFAFP